MEAPSLDKILEEFTSDEQIKKSNLREGGPATIWLPPEYKEKFDNLQTKSGRKFGRKIRELIIAAIDVTENKSA